MPPRPRTERPCASITDRHGRERRWTRVPRPDGVQRACFGAGGGRVAARTTFLKNKRATRRRSDSFRMTPTNSARSRYGDAITTIEPETHEEHARFRVRVSKRVSSRHNFGCGSRSAGRPRVKREAARATRRRRRVKRRAVFALGDLIRGSRTHIPKQDGHLGFHPSSGTVRWWRVRFWIPKPNIVCVFPRTFIPARVGSRRGDRFRERSESCVSSTDGFDRVEVLRRVLVDAPGPVRSIAAHAGWIFVSTERKIALTSFGDFAREPMNFAFARASAAGEKKKGASPDGSETAELGEARPDASVVPFLRARLDPDAETRKLRDMVRPFLPAELRGIEPATGASREAEPSDARRRFRRSRSKSARKRRAVRSHSTASRRRSSSPRLCLSAELGRAPGDLRAPNERGWDQNRRRFGRCRRAERRRRRRDRRS